MDFGELVRIAAEVAGIGGLAICLFALIARYVIKTVPPPGKTPAPSYFKLIDRIILYAFILSMMGLMIYALIKTIDMHNLVAENNSLMQRIKQITDPSLKLNSAAFEVLSCEITFDLTGWHQVPVNELKTTRLSQQTTRNKRVIWRAHPEAEKFSGGTYATDSPFLPAITSLTPRYKLNQIENPDPMQPGKDFAKRWVLEYEVKDAPLFEPFEIVTETTAWNTLQNSREGHEGTLIRIPTRRLSLIVIFPKDKLPKKDGIILKSMPLLFGASASPSNEGRLTISADSSRVEWTIDQPKLGYHYLIYWQW